MIKEKMNIGMVEPTREESEEVTQAIQNSRLDKLDEIIDYYNEPQYDVCEISYSNEFKEMWEKEINIIKQALLKTQFLEKENAEYKRVLEIIFGKEVSIFQLECCKNVNEYNDLQFKKDKKLTEEEFDLLKRYFNGNNL